MGLIGFFVQIVVISIVVLSAVWFSGFLEYPDSMILLALTGLGGLWYLMSTFDD